MKGKMLAGFVMVMCGVALMLAWQQAQASSHELAAVNTVFSSLSSGEVEEAISLFAEDAVVENKVRNETYRGLGEIRQMLAGMQKEGRQYNLVSSAVDGSTVEALVEVSDRGIVWGTQTVVAEVVGDKVQSMAVTAFRLELWRIGSMAQANSN